ncbi:hypothetical protein KIPB_006704 [Kipferlia bialata]|uniref:Uncharacterized protein n=1 Tax=Kipferlia bialata TaxID=797122 RepID=A0A391P3E3_9EUKA|nr:hypothetical protein KIPB_006704 [Kipferlia bialata]|eukprot:g6704.t1
MDVFRPDRYHSSRPKGFPKMMVSVGRYILMVPNKTCDDQQGLYLYDPLSDKFTCCESLPVWDVRVMSMVTPTTLLVVGSPLTGYDVWRQVCLLELAPEVLEGTISDSL